MAKLLEARKDVSLVLIVGATCTGKNTAGKIAAAVLNKRYSSRISPLDIPDSLRESASSADRWGNTLKGIAAEMEVDPSMKAVISGLKTEYEASFFDMIFPENSYFVILNADNNTLAERILIYRAGEFPASMPEDERKAIALEFLADEAKTKITPMLSYLLSGPQAKGRGYIIDTKGQDSTAELEKQIPKALIKFGML
jgi:hypothetical protein